MILIVLQIANLKRNIPRAINGRFGFPSEIINGNEIDMARNETEAHNANETLEEERRLLYVAITRYRKKLYIFLSGRLSSPIISELGPQLEDEKSGLVRGR